jgi:heme-degrading monooxygenase HmoA
MFIAMNNFKVVEGKESEFEQIWKSRETYLHGVPGFVRFALLRGDGGEYVSHSTWESREAFIAWTQSEAFVKGHRQGGSLMGVLAGPPQLRTFEAVIEQDAS